MAEQILHGDQAKCIDMGSLSRNFAFHATAGEIERALAVCLAAC